MQHEGGGLSPGHVQPPQQHQQLDGQVEHEPAVVPLAHAVLDPGAVVVVAAHTVLACLAVLGPHWLLLGKHAHTDARTDTDAHVHTHTDTHTFS